MKYQNEVIEFRLHNWGRDQQPVYQPTHCKTKFKQNIMKNSSPPHQSVLVTFQVLLTIS